MSSINPQSDPENVYPEDNTDTVEEPSENELPPYTAEEVAQTLQIDSAVETAQFEGSAERIINAIHGMG